MTAFAQSRVNVAATRLDVQRFERFRDQHWAVVEFQVHQDQLQVTPAYVVLCGVCVFNMFGEFRYGSVPTGGSAFEQEAD